MLARQSNNVRRKIRLDSIKSSKIAIFGANSKSKILTIPVIPSNENTLKSPNKNTIEESIDIINESIHAMKILTFSSRKYEK